MSVSPSSDLKRHTHKVLILASPIEDLPLCSIFAFLSLRVFRKDWVCFLHFLHSWCCGRRRTTWIEVLSLDAAVVRTHAAVAGPVEPAEGGPFERKSSR
jgi:hypothetical protein